VALDSSFRQAAYRCQGLNLAPADSDYHGAIDNIADGKRRDLANLNQYLGECTKVVRGRESLSCHHIKGIVSAQRHTAIRGRLKEAKQISARVRPQCDVHDDRKRQICAVYLAEHGIHVEPERVPQLADDSGSIAVQHCATKLSDRRTKARLHS
jgi:hypothetical protein